MKAAKVTVTRMRPTRERQVAQRFNPGQSDQEIRKKQRLSFDLPVVQPTDENLGKQSARPTPARSKPEPVSVSPLPLPSSPGADDCAGGAPAGDPHAAALPEMYELEGDVGDSQAEHGSPQSQAGRDTPQSQLQDASSAVMLLPKTPHFQSIARAFVGASNIVPTPQASARGGDGNPEDAPDTGLKRIRDVTAAVISQLDKQFPSPDEREATTLSDLA